MASSNTSTDDGTITPTPSGDDFSASTTDYNADDEECPTPTYPVSVTSSTTSTDSGNTSDTDSIDDSHVFPDSYYRPATPDPDQSLLQAIHSGRGNIPANYVPKEKLALLPYSVIPRLYLPRMNEQGFFNATEKAPVMYNCISLRSPIPAELLVGYESEDDDLTTASRRHYVTQYYTEMMTARFGRMEGEGTYRRSGRLARKRGPTATTSHADPNNQRHWFDRPRCPDEDSS